MEYEPTQADLQALLDLLVDNDQRPAVFMQVNELAEVAKQDRLDPQDVSSTIELEDGTIAHPFMFSEHRFLGNTLQLPDHDTGDAHDKSAAKNPLTLANGLQLTYGEINGFAGDYFGLKDPICMLSSPEKRRAAFKAAFEALAVGSAGKDKAMAIKAALHTLQAEIDTALQSDDLEAVHAIYKKNVSDMKGLDNITQQYKAGAGFLELASSNVDHFGRQARITYNAGHALALSIAAGGDLPTAYAVNAFADHFLQDSFAAGHVRVPRLELFSIDNTKWNGEFIVTYLKAAAARVMHEEDGELGLLVKNPAGEEWHIYGDTQLFDSKNAENMKRCRAAQSESVREVHDAYKVRAVTVEESKFAAWKHAPVLDTVSGKDLGNHLPLLKAWGGQVFKRIGDAKTATGFESKPMVGLSDYLAFANENKDRLEEDVLAQLKYWRSYLPTALTKWLPA